MTPSSAADLQSEELRPLIDRFYRGSTGDAHDRIKLFKLIWDAVGTEFGARHEWYEINYSGNQEQMRLDMLRFAGIRGITGAADDLVDAVPVGIRPRRVDGRAVGVGRRIGRRRRRFGRGRVRARRAGLLRG